MVNVENPCKSTCKYRCISRVKKCVYHTSLSLQCVKPSFSHQLFQSSPPTFTQPPHPSILTIFSTIPQPLQLQLLI